MRLILVFFLLLKILSAQDLQTLLDEFKYETSKQIANKTKKESLGHVVSFTQEDLEMMGVKTLKDILKILPKVSMQTNFFGASNLTYAGNPNSISTSMRLYIDDQELSSVQTLSPWLLYANYPMEHISHIEIYYGESTLHLGNEPAKLTIKLHTKRAYTVSGGILRSSISRQNSNSTTAVYGNDIDDTSLLFMLSHSNVNKYAHLSLKKDEYKLSAGFTKVQKENYLGLAYDLEPDYSKSEYDQYFLEFSKAFNEDLGKVYFSFNQTEKNSTEINQEGILLASEVDFNTFNLPKELDEDLTFRKYDFGLTNIFDFKNYSLYLGGAIKHKEYDINRRDITYFDDTTKSDVKYSNLKSETIYSILSEHSYKLNDSNILIANLKYDKYIKDNGFKNFDFLTSRLGYISALNENYSLKLFLTNTFTPPSMFEIDFASKQKKDLKNENKNIATFEIEYEDEIQNLSLFLNYLEIKDMIVFDSNEIGYINYNEKEFNATGFSLNYERYFNKFNKIHFNYYGYINSIEKYGSPKMGGSIKAYQKFGDFNFYEQLIYKQKYKYNDKLKIDDSFNLSLGLAYNLDKNLQIDFKANNLLDDDMDVVFVDYANNSFKTMSNSNRSYTASLKWVF